MHYKENIGVAVTYLNDTKACEAFVVVQRVNYFDTQFAVGAIGWPWHRIYFNPFCVMQLEPARNEKKIGEPMLT